MATKREAKAAWKGWELQTLWVDFGSYCCWVGRLGSVCCSVNSRRGMEMAGMSGGGAWGDGVIPEVWAVTREEASDSKRELLTASSSRAERLLSCKGLFHSPTSAGKTDNKDEAADDSPSSTTVVVAVVVINLGSEWAASKFWSRRKPAVLIAVPRNNGVGRLVMLVCSYLLLLGLVSEEVQF